LSYKSWFENHAQKHKKIVDKLLKKGFTKEKIIEYFCYDNMVKNEKDFCPLYTQNKKCHEMQHLNCYLCACPNFRFKDEGILQNGEYTIKSKCSINNGKTLASKGNIHQDCSSCSVPHHKSFIEKNFENDWKKIMKECSL